jgi:antitoxin MazE
MKVSKWGNSLAIRLPAAVVEALNLKAGDEINVRVASEGNFLIGREPTREELIGRIRQLSRPLPPGFRFDREEANARAR